MAKKHIDKKEEGKETVAFFKNLDQKAVNAEKFIERNAKAITLVFGVLILAVLGYFAYNQFILEPKNEEALKGYLAAQKQLNQGKEVEALGGKSAANPGFLGTYNEYSGTKVGKLAAYNAGLLKYNEGKYKEAYDLLDKFSSKNELLMAMKYGAMADCQTNLNQPEDALSLLDKAATTSKDEYTAYYFTRKAGILSIALNKKSEAKKFFTTIDEKYQDYDNGLSDMFIEMVKYY